MILVCNGKTIEETASDYFMIMSYVDRQDTKVGMQWSQNNQNCSLGSSGFYSSVKRGGWIAVKNSYYVGIYYDHCQEVWFVSEERVILSERLEDLRKAVEWGERTEKETTEWQGQTSYWESKGKNDTFDVGYQDRVDIAKSLFGSVPDGLTLEEAKEGRLSDWWESCCTY